MADNAIAGGPNRAANCAALGIPAGWDDPLAGAANNVLIGGQSDLDETSNSWTLVWVFDYAKCFYSSFRAAVDYWNIELDDAISENGRNNHHQQRRADAPDINNDFCALVTRNSSDYSISTAVSRARKDQPGRGALPKVLTSRLAITTPCRECSMVMMAV